jgi:hypothetical protein
MQGSVIPASHFNYNEKGSLHNGHLHNFDNGSLHNGYLDNFDNEFSNKYKKKGKKLINMFFYL